MPTVGVIARAISMVADCIVLAITLRQTFYIFKEDKEAKENTNITTTLAYSGNVDILLPLIRHY